MADPGVEHAQVPHPTHEVETHVTPTTVEQNAAPAINGHAAPQAEVPAPPPPPAAESPAGAGAPPPSPTGPPAPGASTAGPGWDAAERFFARDNDNH